MQSSTFYANDIWGCIKMNISVPDAYGKLDMALRKVQMWGLNPTNSGQIRAESYQLNSTDEGVLTYKVLALLDSEKYTILDTDYTSYLIVYECAQNFPYVLNATQDAVHIFTRSEDDTSNLTTYKTNAETLTGLTLSFEDIVTDGCGPVVWQSKLAELVTDPANFFRKW